VALIGVLALNAAAVVLAVFLSLQSLRQTGQAWCPALRDLTREKIDRPPDPEGHSIQARQYRLYVELTNVKHGLGCPD